MHGRLQSIHTLSSDVSVSTRPSMLCWRQELNEAIGLCMCDNPHAYHDESSEEVQHANAHDPLIDLDCLNIRLERLSV